MQCHYIHPSIYNTFPVVKVKIADTKTHSFLVILFLLLLSYLSIANKLQNKNILEQQTTVVTATTTQ